MTIGWNASSVALRCWSCDADAPARTAVTRPSHVVDYHHVIHALRRKPMALLNLVYRDQLFPREAYRHSWEALLAALPPRTACRTMVGLLALAHDRTCEGELAIELEAILGTGGCPTWPCCQQFAPPGTVVPTVTVTLPAAITYDARNGSPQEWLCSTIEVDTTRLPLLLHELRLPAIARLWSGCRPC